MKDGAPVLQTIREGRTVPLHACDCGRCGNEWFVPGYSDEWHPSFCPFCGMKFNASTINHGNDDEPDEFTPFWNDNA